MSMQNFTTGFFSQREWAATWIPNRARFSCSVSSRSPMRCVVQSKFLSWLTICGIKTSYLVSFLLCYNKKQISHACREYCHRQFLRYKERSYKPFNNHCHMRFCGNLIFCTTQLYELRWFAFEIKVSNW